LTSIMKSILLYHNIAPTLSPFGGVVSPSTFRRHIRYIKNLGLKFLSPEEFFKNSNGILLTFDDGFEELYKYAFPILQDEKVCALVFVVSGYAGKKNDWDITLGKSFTHLPWKKIREMHRYGIAVGSHSHLHPDYTRVSKELVKEDLWKSYDKVSEEIGESVKYFSYPFGRAGEKEWEMTRKAGFKRAFTSIPVQSNNPYYLGRWGVYTIDNTYTLSLKIGSNRNLRGLERWKCFSINWVSNGTGVLKS